MGLRGSKNLAPRNLDQLSRNLLFLGTKNARSSCACFLQLSRAVLQGFLERLAVYLESPRLRCFGQITLEVEKVSGQIFRV